MLEKLLDQIKDEGPNLPNKFTIALGKLIRRSRLDIEMSQAQLAKLTYLKQSSVSRIEDGRRALSAEELLYFSYALDKPIGFFFPEEFTSDLSTNDLSESEKELLLAARQLDKDDLRKLTAQARAIAKVKPQRDDRSAASNTRIAQPIHSKHSRKRRRMR